MRRAPLLLLLKGLGISAAFAGAGCSALPPDCPDRLRCSESVVSDGSSSSSGDSVDSGALCALHEDGSIVPDECGVFVSTSGDDSNAGTKAKPVATIAQAIKLAAKGSGRIYACAQSFPEPITLSDAITLEGGLECLAGWAYTGTSHSTLAPKKGVPLLLRGTASGAKISDFVFAAPQGDVEGASSIAVIADGVTAALTRCSLLASIGADGASGLSASATPAASGKAGSPGGLACTAAVVVGGAGASTSCGGTTSSGGQGGLGTATIGGGGLAGLPALGKGMGGIGDPGMAGWSCAVGGGDGGNGLPGLAGPMGIGGTGLGQISTVGYAGVSGGAGVTGGTGQGGGGGGGRAGASVGVCSAGKGGASGGGGGAGGCGGAGGGGGMAGGASIALLSLQSTLSLTAVTLIASHGGRGGDGGLSQAGGVGGAGGPGGNGINAGCLGGRGGDGGAGGIGGGGAGGHSIGLAYRGTKPFIEDGWITVDVAGLGGASTGNPGANGVSAKQQAFD